MNGFIKLGLLAAVGMVGTGVAADAAVIFQDGFEYQDQAAFNASWTTIGASPTLSSSPSPVKTGEHAVLIPGSTANTPRASKQVAATGVVSASNVVSFSVDFFDTSAGNAPQRNFVNLQAVGYAGGSGQLVSVGLSNNLTSTDEGGNYYMARILGYNGTGSPFFKLNEGDASTLRQTGWNNLRVDISDADFKFYVDGALARTVANTYLDRSYDSVFLGSGLPNNNVPVSFDNVVLGTNLPIPEPTSLALIGLAGFALLSRRRGA